MTSTIFLNITMSVFVIGETTNNKHYSTQLKTHVWIRGRPIIGLADYRRRY